MIRAGFLLVFIGVASFARTEPATVSSLNLLGESALDFENRWIPRGFPLIASTEYSVSESESGAVVVRSRSVNANRAMLRELVVEKPEVVKLSWRWRVKSELKGQDSERTKSGDDYSARVFVVFETSFIPTRTRAINYVWAAKESSETSFPSPYTKNVLHVVLRSTGGDTTQQDWQFEARDVMRDYIDYFGEPPSKISGVAIMTDTDNTNGSAEAEFTELNLEITPAPQDSGS